MVPAAGAPHCRWVSCEEDVTGLDVAVDESRRVSAGERIGDLAGDVQRIRQRQLAFLVQPLGHRHAVDERHYIIWEPIYRAGVEHWHDVGVLKPRRDPNLAHEPFAAEDGRKLPAENFYCNPRLVHEIAGEVHGRHPAATGLPLDLVPAADDILRVYRCR